MASERTGNECLICDRLVDRGDSVWLEDGRLVHLSCYRILAEMLFSGQYSGLNVGEMLVIAAMRIHRERGGE